MILLKANAELKKVFYQLIKTMGVHVIWNEMFLIINNNLILPGDVRSLFLNFDNKKAVTNIIDIPLNQDKAQDIADNEILTNTLNMTLYAFGKWGVISGLKVEKNYAQLNRLFQHILKEVMIEPSFRDDNFRFCKDGVQITYEDVIQEILNLSKEEEKLEEAAKNEGTEESLPGEGLGLWHSMKWVTQKHTFEKDRSLTGDTSKSRLGHNFYQVEYNCPECGEKLYMVLYPVNKEFLIETDEERVYLARAYTCSTCDRFYTPRPGRLLQEGDVYVLEFEDDKNAYEDYLELLGKSGGRTPNYKFNEYESERNKRNEEPKPLKEVCQNIEDMAENELEKLQDMMDDGFFPWEEVDTYYEKVEKNLSIRKQSGTDSAAGKQDTYKHAGKGTVRTDGRKGKEKHRSESAEAENPAERQERKQENVLEEDIPDRGKTPGIYGRFDREQDFSAKSIDELKDMVSGLSEGRYEEENSEEAMEIVKRHLLGKLRDKFDSCMDMLGKLSIKQLEELKDTILAEGILEEEERRQYMSRIDKTLYKIKERELAQKEEACREKSYAEIGRVMEEITASEAPESLKEPVLQSIRRMKRLRGEKEVEQLISKMPAQMDRKQYQSFRERLEQYRDVDIKPYERLLDERRDMAEKQEINTFIKRANKRDRNALSTLYDQLTKQGFAERNVEPFLKKIHDKIYAMDEAAIEKIIPDIMDISFEEGMEAYEKISSGMYLPELKVNILEMIDKRLTKIKMDESTQLVRKLRKEVEENMTEYSRFHFYDVRKTRRSEEEDKEADIVEKALTTYAEERNKYEFPVLIYDSSKANSGKEGFVLTPDNLFYSSRFSQGRIPVSDIESITVNSSLFNKGVFIYPDGQKKIKMPVSMSAKEWTGFAKIMDEFIDYLQEKPESRSISYLAREKHAVKCCYRCGYSYKEGNICPKCGSKSNR